VQNKKLTPLMQQYWKIKNFHKDKILLFRMGDFFEMFYEDAEKAAPILNIALTVRNKKAEDQAKMCGVPHHSISGPISKLLNAGLKVAICDQVEPVSQAKGLVKRAVTRVLTPGMVYDPESLDKLSAHYLCAFDDHSMSFLDISTGEAFFYLTANKEIKTHLISLLNPVELVLTTEQKKTFFGSKKWAKFHISVFETKKTDFISENLPTSAWHLLSYIKHQQGEEALKIIQPFQEKRIGQEMWFSSQAQDHLEIFKTYKGEHKGSLFVAINRTKTPAGARLLKSRLICPSTKQKEINKRLDAVENWIHQSNKMNKIRSLLPQVGDMERKIGKITHPQCHSRDLLTLAESLNISLQLVALDTSLSLPDDLCHSIHQLVEEINNTIRSDAPLGHQNGNIIKKGVSESLDKLIEQNEQGQSSLRKMEDKERLKNNIPSLKIRYNNVFGYYIEVTKVHSKKVPSYYIRKQTLTQAERYTTEKLQSIEEKLFSSRVRKIELEIFIFEQLRKKIIHNLPDLFYLSRVICGMDLDSSLAYLAIEQSYTRPQFSSNNQLILKNSRHPVVEQKHHFISNTIRMKEGECLLLTGPNMAGKSTLMRQVALSVILAQAGSFIPATEGLIPIFNKLLTRIGASDSISEGFSTFMVEMKESAEIIQQADAKSLVILDEIGRGTATYDGMSLAQALLEYLVQRKKSLIFFATHYHEMTVLSKSFPKIRNAHLSVSEKNGQIDFLYTLVSGALTQSYGIHVARLAGFPMEIVSRAEELLQSRESNTNSNVISHRSESQMDLLDTKVDTNRKNQISHTNINQQKGITKASSYGSPDTGFEYFKNLLQTIKDYPLQEKSPLETMNNVAKWKAEILEKNK